MPSIQTGQAPNLSIFLKSLNSTPVQSSIENLISLLKRRQIHGSRPCAIATAQLLLRVVAMFKWTDVGKLLIHLKEVGKSLVEAQPREVVVGNIVRRVQDMIKDEAKEDRLELDSDSASNGQGDFLGVDHNNLAISKLDFVPKTCNPSSMIATANAGLRGTYSDDALHNHLHGTSQLFRPTLTASRMSYTKSNGSPMPQTMFNLLSTTNSPSATPPGTNSTLKPTVSAFSLAQRIATTVKDLKAEIISGIEEIIDELHQVNDQIAGYAQEHIHSNEIILTNSACLSVKKFLLKAAEKRNFTLIMIESYPNEHKAVHSVVTGKLNSFHIEDEDEDIDTETFLQPLSAAGVTVILMSDASVFAIMSRVNKVILSTHAVIANGGLIADAGTLIIAKAARVHRTPVVVVSGVYKLSPEYPYEIDSLIEYGDPGKVIPFSDGALVDSLEIFNPVYDYVPPDLVDLYITNLGAHAPSYLYRIVADHYHTEDP